MKALLMLLMTISAGGAVTPARPVFRISGTAVSMRDGSPIPFCRLHVAPMTSASVAATTVRPGGREGRPGRGSPVDMDAITADAQGHFSIDVPAAGGWDLRGTARGFHSQDYEGHEGFSSAIVLTAAAPIASITFRMQPDASLVGNVFDEMGEPVAEAQIVAEDATNLATGHALAYGLTDDRGHYELAGLSPGSYKVRVQGRPWYSTAGGAINTRLGSNRGANVGVVQTPGLDPSLDVVYPMTWFGGGEDERTAGVIRLAGGEVREANVSLQPLASAHLVVPRGDAAPAGLAAEDRGWSGPLVTRISAEGFNGPVGAMNNSPGNGWDVGGLAPGVYQVRMPGPAGELNADVRQFTVRAGGAGIVDLSSAVRLLNVTLTYDGAEPGSAEITFVSLEDGSRYSVGDGFRGRGGARRGRNQDGDDQAQRVISVPPGKYSVSLPQGVSVFLTGLAGANGAEVSGTTVRVMDGSPSVRLQFATGRAEVKGLVSAAEKPAVGAMVLLVPAVSFEAFDAAGVERDQTNTDGSYELHAVLPGRYILVALDHGWDVNWRDPATLARYLVHGKPVEIRAHGEAEVDLEATEP